MRAAAANHLWELYYGGFVAPDIFYLGAAGVVQFGGLRIGGVSGIYKSHDYAKGHYEYPPYDNSAIKANYHVRQLEIHRLSYVQHPLDIFLSHDWPVGVTEYGDKATLYRQKPYFRDEAERGELGSVPNRDLLFLLRPTYWFSAHLHCKFAALIPHQEDPRGCKEVGGGGRQREPRSVTQPPPKAETEVTTSPPPASSTTTNNNNTHTRFLALDKCVPRAHFLQVLRIPVTPGRTASTEKRFCLDEEWLSILSATHYALSRSKHAAPCPFPPRWTPSETGDRVPDAVADVVARMQVEGEAIRRRILANANPSPHPAAEGDGSTPTFTATARSYNPAQPQRGVMPQDIPINPQTSFILSLLGKDFNLGRPDPREGHHHHHRLPRNPCEPSLPPPLPREDNPEEIDLDDDGDDNDI